MLYSLLSGYYIAIQQVTSRLAGFQQSFLYQVYNLVCETRQRT